MRALTAVAIALTVVLVGVVAGGVYQSAEFGLPDGPAPDEARVLSFESGGGQCVETTNRNITSTQRGSDRATVIETRANVTVPDANYALTDLTITKVGERRYVVSFESEEVPEKAARNCQAMARYHLTFEVPHGQADRFNVTVEYNGEETQWFENGPDGSGSGANAGGSDATT
ncbi:hypothetical protein [Haladaptatus sp. DYSN1]|uniref:hypothetical protein n=1 Tax=unclassified Haladaptatus TaxID=2622732 RepID=UPI00240698AE|nr:hypothetical protein [Haladaptatus sp. DYSN1]